MMKLLVLIPLIILSLSRFGANLSCLKHYEINSIQFYGPINSKHKQLIVDAVKNVNQVHQNEEPIRNIRFEIVSDNRFAGGEAHLSESLISIQKHSFNLPPKEFQALIEHEVNHFFVARNFTSPNKKTSLVEYLQRYKDDPERTFMATENHAIFAELLCDLVSILNHRNPKIFKSLHEHLINVFPQDVSQKLSQSLKNNEPIELSMRDFSINPTDPKWRTFNPKSGVIYHRFNQIRAHLWNKWISKLPKEMNALFYQTIEKTFNEIQQQVYFESLFLQTPMNKTELIDALAAKCDLSKASAGRAVDGLMEIITETVVEGDTVSLIGFGTFGVGQRAARTGRNPKTGAALNIAASKTPKFSAGAKLKAAVNK